MLFSTLLTFSTLLATALAAPFAGPIANAGYRRDVVDPEILTPNPSTVWVVGSSYNVTWKTSDLPPPQNITNIIGMVVLGQLTADGGEHLFLDTPLAKGFNITVGTVEITVPQVQAGDYIIVLFGDSGNASPQFRIAASSSATGSATVTPPASPSSTPASNTSSRATPSNPLSLPPSVTSDTSTPTTSPPTTSGSSTSISFFSPPATISAGSSSSSSSSSSAPPPTPPPPLPTSNGASWLHANSCLTFAAVAISAVLMV